MTKLTLSVEEEVVEQAKRIAEANQTSVSAMFSRFVQSLAAPRESRPEIGPLTRKLSGIIRLPPGKDYKDALADALEDRYRIAK
jgi:hypothetical protein